MACGGGVGGWVGAPLQQALGASPYSSNGPTKARVSPWPTHPLSPTKGAGAPLGLSWRR